jgi:glycosyltransferase involved in cell wall biosynthesis
VREPATRVLYDRNIAPFIRASLANDTDVETGTRRGPRVKARAARVLMLGTAPEGRGGVAAVVAGLRDAGLFEREAVRYVPTHAEGSRAAKARRALSGFWHTAAACAFARPAIVHAHSASRASFLRKSLLLLLARAAGCKTVFHLHGGGFRQFATGDSGALMRRWIRHTLEHSSLVIALSDGWAQFVRGFAPGARVAVLPNSVALPALPAAGAEQPGRILFLGRVEAAKGIDELLRAAAALAPSLPALRLAIGGEGDLARVRARAAELGIADRVELLGWLDARRRDAELARAAVFCLPSHAEGLPMAMLEAMAAARAVVVTNVGAIPEAVAHGDNGLLVAPRDGAALAAALERVLADDALRARLGRRARETVEQRYSGPVVAERLAALWRELAAAP